ncbi:mitochondrial import inner membrane translocase subunit TIM44, putative [Plasmodium sp. DRC-Itaito]|nr:mitochondrial import inner membrane translocase subunit TIM44, putative [Plasmodium sp. DRC-Itaito]
MKKNIFNNVFINIKFQKNLKYNKFISSKCIQNIYITNKWNSTSCVYNQSLCTPTQLISTRKKFSTFMRNVIEQVKKDMKENKQYQEALKELKEKTEIDDKRIRLKKRIEENIDFFQKIKEKNVEAVKILYNDVNNFVTYCFTKYYALKLSKNLCIQFFITLKNVFIKSTNKFTELSEKWDENSAFVKLDKWRQDMAIKRYKKEKEKENQHNNNIDEENDNCILDNNNEQSDNIININKKKKKKRRYTNIMEENNETENDNSQNYELILAQESAWDKFGSKLKDMPFLNNFFENPILGKLFGETELAAALREMKMIDKNFKLSELMYLFEYVISKHIVESYLIGDEETLRLHCGSSAFNSLNASITERKKKKVFLDTNVLIYKNHELKGAQRMEESSPWLYIVHIYFSHTTNQLPEIIEGKIDDIREVVYTIALSKHPEPEKEGLLYPYIVREFAIIGNTPSW